MEFFISSNQQIEQKEGKQKTMRYITFAWRKGALQRKAMALLEEIGITCEEMKDEKTRKLIFVNED